MLKRLLLFFTLLVLSQQIVYSSSQVIDIELNEYVQESVTYNPLKIGAGLFHDNNENQTQYNLFGEIKIKNIQNKDTLYAINLSFANFSNIYNLTYISGYKAFPKQTGSSLEIYIPELPPNQTSTLTYNVHTNSIEPPLNFSTSYNAAKFLTGTNVTVTDTISNNMNPSTYSDTCIYNISINQNTKSVTEPNSPILNFTYITSSISGADSSHVSFPNMQTMNWNVKNKVCLYHSNQTSINYKVKIPYLTVQNSYPFINSTIIYRYNSTISKLGLKSQTAALNIDPKLQKRFEGGFTGTEAIWEVYGEVSNPSNITTNLKSVTFWVSTRNSISGGFTNISDIDKDTVNAQTLYKNYTPNQLLNSTTSSWNNNPLVWSFNYTLESSPIVWMNLQNEVIDDGVQFGNRKVSYSNDKVYIKEIFVATGYWLELTKQITRIGNNSYNIYILLRNIGPKQTPSNQVVLVYNFLHKDFSITSPFITSSSSWYTTDFANKTINESQYDGTMYQFALLSNNIYNSSLDKYSGSTNINNSWSVSYNVTGSGQFNIEDLFLAGVDPLNVEGYGASAVLTIDNSYTFGTDTWNYILVTSVVVLGILAYVF